MVPKELVFLDKLGIGFLRTGFPRQIKDKVPQELVFLDILIGFLRNWFS